MEQKSLKLNMILNAVKGLLGILFPLITFPYISKVLGVENIGKYNFAYSIINYFVLIAGLGIATYAVREGAYIRGDLQKLQRFSDEIFSLNIVSTVFSYLLLIVVAYITPKMQEYKILLFILSLQIMFKALGVEWIYSIYEDYTYITIRSVLFQIISLILMFSFVKTDGDINKYAIITVISAVGSNILNYVHSKRYLTIRLIKNFDWKIHAKPIMVLFATTLMVTVYVSSDITILGFLCNDEIVGVYSVSTKIYTIVKTILSSVIVVSIPRISALLSNGNREVVNAVAQDIYETLLSISLPAVTGIILLRKQIVLLISAQEYIRATSSLLLLSIALFFCMGVYFWGQCILVPLKKEKIVFKATVLSALANIILNLILIPIWQENAAAFSTIVAEAISYYYCLYWGKQEICIQNTEKTIIKIIIGCIGIVLVVSVFHNLIGNKIVYLITSIAGSIFIYVIIEILLKNHAVSTIAGIRHISERFSKKNN